MSNIILPRRRFIQGAALATGSLALAGCDSVTDSDAVLAKVRKADNLTWRAHRTVVGRDALAQEFSRADMSPKFKQNGSTNVDTAEFRQHVAEGFANWRLVVDGLVANPLAMSLAQLMAMPAREQITRHDCVEGWSAIGQWRGTPLGMLLKAAKLSTRARFVVFHCADTLDGRKYYESVDLIDAFHPQTILAWGMNGGKLAVAHGAPLRLRVERLLGYKQAKFVMRVEAVESLARFGDGNGGYWEDVSGYEWYGGI
jgi:DMSO/TMAO reductase YedYZ molybdopterin-dependent catalytic subunit